MSHFALTPAAVRSWCERKNVRYLINQELGQLAIRHPKEPELALRFIPRPDRGMFTLALPLLWSPPEGRYPQMDAAIGLLNASTYMGAWILNHARGEVYFRVTLPMNGLQLDDDGLLSLVRIVFGTVDSVSGPLRAVALEGAEPSSVLPKQG